MMWHCDAECVETFLCTENKYSTSSANDSLLLSSHLPEIDTGEKVQLSFSQQRVQLI